LFYQTYSGGLGFIHWIFTQNTENHTINLYLFWQKWEFEDVDLRPAELRSAPDSIKLCNRQLGNDYTYYMSPNTNVTRICDWATANLNPCNVYINAYITTIYAYMLIIYAYIYNIRTLSVNIKFICTTLERGRIASLWRAFQAYFAASTNAFYI
jgi:hypothetical protein